MMPQDGSDNGSRSLRLLAPTTYGRVRLRTLVYIRWIAVAAQLTTILLVHYALGFRLQIVLALIVVGASALLNVVVTVRQPLGMRLSDRVAALYLAYDVLQLSALLFLTGGLQNPFSVLILASVIVSATVLSRGSTIGLGLLAGICITLLALWYRPFPWQDPGFQLPDFYILGIWQALIVSVMFIASYVGSVAEESRRMSDALAATQVALGREQRVSELGALAAAAAHELGSPLATIAVTAKEMARDVPKDSPLAADIALLIEQSNRCRDILADLARRPPDDGGEPYSRMPVSALVELAGQPYTIEASIEFDAGANSISANSPEPVVTRSPEIIRGLGTLIQNAAQFAESLVTVETRWDDNRVTVSVRDDGPGYPSNLLDRLGEPYISTRDEDGEHMGLGIFISSNLLNRTGAVLTFRNRPQGGAHVTVAWTRSDLENFGKVGHAASADTQAAA